jgi:hypothetical protein
LWERLQSARQHRQGETGITRKHCGQREGAGYYVVGICREKGPCARADLRTGPGIIDLSLLAANAKGVARIALVSVQDMPLPLALQLARDDCEDRRERQRQGIELATCWLVCRAGGTPRSMRASWSYAQEGGQQHRQHGLLVGMQPASAQARVGVGEAGACANSTRRLEPGFFLDFDRSAALATVRARAGRLGGPAARSAELSVPLFWPLFS